MARAGGKCTDRLNRRGGTNHNRQAIRLEPKAGESPPPTKNITQTQSRVKGMLLKIGIFFGSRRAGKDAGSSGNESERKER